MGLPQIFTINIQLVEHIIVEQTLKSENAIHIFNYLFQRCFYYLNDHIGFRQLYIIYYFVVVQIFSLFKFFQNIVKYF